MSLHAAASAADTRGVGTGRQIAAAAAAAASSAAAAAAAARRLNLAQLNLVK